ncbi:putative serine protease K12H4.7 [Maniola jurtina]|uniref:putative serine protease K12H4.7 n=1 Tax=Maniola jurtina TaxID=191418 RepID=UPI001E68C56C|nr:putative serine protease K12H4.7 [Maniola jurtina]
MPRSFSVVVICFQLIVLVQGAKRFHLGRSKGGNLGEPAGISGVKLPPAQWFIQKLDHSRPTDTRTWKQRYFVNDSFYDFNNPGPIFLMIGGEGPASAKWMVQGAWIEYAKQFNALCIQLEHRYYGESHPTMDLSTKNLLYLSSHQALADLANFISAMNDKYKFNREVKWIAFGGSYPGSLAAWLRLKYPHLVHAAISSSGPLLAKVNFMEYFQVVVNSLREKTGDEDCVTRVKLAHQQIETFLKTDPAIIEKEFKVCKPFSKASENDMKNFYSSIADDFADLVQYNEDNRISDKRRKTTTINSVCSMLTQHPEKPEYQKLAEFNSIVLEESDETCLDYDYSKLINGLRNVSWSSEQAEGGRQWMYQTCTEFGFYQTSSGEVEVFGNQFPLDFFIQQCQDVFGTKFNAEFVSAGAEWTNRAYGGLDIAAGRVAYVHGSVDPWHALGMTTTQDNDAPAIFIEGTAHCANMYPPSANDSTKLVAARVEIQSYIGSWLNLP